MLTERELEWLKARPRYTNPPDPWKDDWDWPFDKVCRVWAGMHYEKHVWFQLLYYDGIRACGEHDFLKDAVEFEASVAACLAESHTEYNCFSCSISSSSCEKVYREYHGCPCPKIMGSAWYNLRNARILVEEEMDHAD